MHLIRSLLFFSLMATAVGCGGSAARLHAIQAGGGVGDSTMPPVPVSQWSSDPALRQKVAFEIPAGWRTLAPDTFRNDALRETISLVVSRSHRTVQEEMVILCARQRGFGFLCDTGHLTFDESQGIFPIRRGDVNGQVIVVHVPLRVGRYTVFIIGLWPSDRDGEAFLAFKQFVGGIVMDTD